ncbi:MAG: hypothetical protein AAFY71_21730 [Bacteroidota bacterium]
MVNNAFPYRLFTSLLKNKGRFPYPVILKETVKKRDLSEVGKLEDFFTQELQQASFESPESINYFFFAAREAMLLSFYRKDFHRFQNQMEVIQHRSQALRSIDLGSNSLATFDAFLELLDVAFYRLIKHIAIEKYENHLDGLDFSIFAQDEIAEISSIIGFVYLNEENHEQKQKGRMWLMKASGEFSNDERLNPALLTAAYFAEQQTTDAIAHLEAILTQVSGQHDQLSNEELSFLYKGAMLELEGVILGKKFSLPKEDDENLEQAQLQIKEYETKFAQEAELPNFLKAKIYKVIAGLYQGVFRMTNDDLEQASFAKQGIQALEHSINLSIQMNDETSEMGYRLHRAEFHVVTDITLTEKEIKEVLQFYKKRQDYPAYVKAVHTYTDLHQKNNSSKKSYDLIGDMFKLGQKKMEQGGFYLITEGLSLANKVFSHEVTLPGVSWLVEELDEFFQKVVQASEQIQDNMELIGISQIERFRQKCLEFEPVSHFNIKVYFQYQLLQIQLMRLGSLINDDQISLRFANKLMSSITSKNNPMSFIQASWKEFKDVPNEVRNKTLNKCINITKGDLPRAAEHLEFSYRNLRSYITFKEVNRLGFFLELQETNNKQLEQGIRYMFYDLYKQGTIFEVVFDMPKFLVEHAKSGFYSQDLESKLKIKGTTAKKYIKIMIENGLIRQDKTTGRRHYYRLIRENVMNRLGKDQNTLIEAAV